MTEIVQLLNEKQAAELTGYSVAWFQRKRWAGGGPAYRKINRSIRYPADLLQEYIESYKLQTSTSEDAEK